MSARLFTVPAMTDMAEAIRTRLAAARDAGEPLPSRPEPGTMVEACGGDGYKALFWTLFFMNERYGVPRRPAAPRRRGRGAYHRWTDLEDRRVLDLSVSCTSLAVELGVPASTVKARRHYLRSSPYAPRVAA